MHPHFWRASEEVHFTTSPYFNRILSEDSKQSSKKSVFTSYFVCSSIAKYFRIVYEMDDILQKKELELNVTQKDGFNQPALY